MSTSAATTIPAPRMPHEQHHSIEIVAPPCDTIPCPPPDFDVIEIDLLRFDDED